MAPLPPPLSPPPNPPKRGRREGKMGRRGEGGGGKTYLTKPR